MHACSHFLRQILTWHGIYANDYIHELNYCRAHLFLTKSCVRMELLINRVITIHDHYC